MNSVMVYRVISALAWISGASASAVLYLLVSIYLLGTFDPVYGRLGTFQLFLAFAGFVLVCGFLGYAIGANGQRPLPSFLAGVLFAVLSWSCLYFLGWLMPNKNQDLLTLVAGAVALGAGSIAWVPKRAA